MAGRPSVQVPSRGTAPGLLNLMTSADALAFSPVFAVTGSRRLHGFGSSRPVNQSRPRA